MSDAQWAALPQIIGALVTLVAAIGSVLAAYQSRQNQNAIAQAQRGQQRQERKVDDLSAVLDVNTQTTDEVHGLVNGLRGETLSDLAAALRQVADLTRGAVPKAAAEVMAQAAETKSAEHQSQLKAEEAQP